VKLIPGTVTIEFTIDEARRLKESLMSEITWSDTSEEMLYCALYDTLAEGVND
jgi:hypothetical protein